MLGFDLTHRPCGACRALVDVTRGCEHWHPRTRVTRRVRHAPDFARTLAIHRIAESTRQRAMLEAASADPRGRVDPGKDRAAREPAKRMARHGLLRPVTRGGAFEITELGREVLKKIRSL